ncbi:MAG: hypothetical protein WB392_08450 [Methanotrichaceae archaeon]
MNKTLMSAMLNVSLDVEERMRTRFDLLLEERNRPNGVYTLEKTVVKEGI